MGNTLEMLTAEDLTSIYMVVNLLFLDHLDPDWDGGFLDIEGTSQ